MSLLRYLGLRSLTPPHTFIIVERWKWKEAEEEDQRTQEKGIQRKRYSEAKTVLHHKKKMVLKRNTRRRKLRQETGLPGHPTRLPIVQMTGPRILSRLVPNTLPLQQCANTLPLRKCKQVTSVTSSTEGFVWSSDDVGLTRALDFYGGCVGSAGPNTSI